AHAGAGGDEERFIFALELAAKQVRIGPHLAQAPEEQDTQSPEIARVQEGKIVVEPARKR
ncbi:septum site-determining protein MinC, partial [Acinetobacter baumannii]